MRWGESGALAASVTRGREAGSVAEMSGKVTRNSLPLAFAQRRDGAAVHTDQTLDQ